MAIYSPKFDATQFELRKEINDFLSDEQRTRATNATDRVSAQLDWLGQLLGWSGVNYWSAFNPTTDQKRQLLSGSYGVYNGYLYPELLEVRNFENSILIKFNENISGSQAFILNGIEYVSERAEKVGDNLIIYFTDLPQRFYDDIANGYQLKVIAVSTLPAPFARPFAGISGDRSFLCKVEGSSIELFPSYDNEMTLPYVYKVFFAGSRYYFNLPVKLIVSDDYYIAPTYQFDTENWFIDIPCEVVSNALGLSARLDYNGAFTIVGIKRWEDPSDWVDKNKIDLFSGVWGNKGGPLPFHFTFDALSLHGFDDRKSLYLAPIHRNLSFDRLLNLVYQQTTTADPLPPPITNRRQLWWDSQNGTLAVYGSETTNCGPWIETYYPTYPNEPIFPDFVFPNVADFESYTEDFFEGCVIEIVDSVGLGGSGNIYGCTSALTSSGKVLLLKNGDEEWWQVLQINYTDVLSFAADSLVLPPNVKVIIDDSDGLTGIAPEYTVANLATTISGAYAVELMKQTETGNWFLSPPTEMKFIGDTRLFESSLDFANPVDGEMAWDFANPDPQTRTACIFYYNRWEQNLLTSEWELKGDWVGVNTGLMTTEPPYIVNLGVILVYCDETLLTSGSDLITNDYQIRYTNNPSTGELEFSYFAKSYEGLVRFPKISISDSLTTAFRADITSQVFSGLTYYMSPNVADGETLLRTKNFTNLYCRDSSLESTSLSYPNGLVADLNEGPLSTNWDRFFVRLPPSYQRNGSHWQKVNLVCQNFSYWGSSPLPEDMGCPSPELKPVIYDELYLLEEIPTTFTYIYAEPYLYSNVTAEYGSSDEYEPSLLLPTYDDPYDTFSEAELVEYEPLHERRADTDSPMGRGYGEWVGEYYRMFECSSVTGHLINDIVSEVLDPVDPPMWDASIYKAPISCLLDQDSGKVDANHYKVGYAHFAADLSAAEEAIFDFA